MDWQQLKEYFDQTYDFFDRIGVAASSDEQSVAIHPLLKLSTNLALKALSSASHNRLIILLPNRLQCARWIATLCALEIMKRDYGKSPDGAKFSKGQKLMVNRCVVEYSREEFIPRSNKRYMWVGCSDGDYGIPLDRKLVFQPANTSRPLSSLLKVSQAYNSAQVIDNQVDYILGTKTMGNKALFKTNLLLVSRIGETEHFAKVNYINGTSIMDLFLWGKLNGEGDVSIIGPQQIQANPCCLISTDLVGAWNYVSDNPQRNKGVIIDGSSNYIDNVRGLDDILDEKIPVVVVCGLLETENLQPLLDRKFKIWQWNRENIIQSGTIIETRKSSPFSSINDSISSFYYQKIDLLLCEYLDLNSVIEEAMKLDRLISRDQQLNVSYGKLFQLINEISRLIRIPQQTWSKIFLQKLQLLRQQFRSQQLWLSDEAIQCINTIFSMLSGLGEKPFAGENHKAERLFDFISKVPEPEVLGIVVAKKEEIEESLSYWTAYLPEEKLGNIHFATVDNLLDLDRSFVPTQIVICGWLGKSRMYTLLHSHVTSKITILAYPFEQKWFISAQRRWTQQNSVNIHAKDFSEMLGLTEKELELIEYKTEEHIGPVRKDELDIIEFELKLRRYWYQRYAPSMDPQDKLSRAKLVIFARGRYAFISESHRLLVVTDLMKGGSYERVIPRKYIGELRPGDYVLFQESSRDIIREIADGGLIKDGQPHLRKIAGLWKEALHEAYWKMPDGLDGLVELLRKAGCRRHPATIKNWLVDEDQIGPKTSADLQFIARATDSKSLFGRLDEVKEAISRVRGAHLQASTYIRNKLLVTLPEIVGGKQGLSSYASESTQLNLDEFGQVTILRIEEISDAWEEISANSVNRLLEEED